MHPLLTPLQLPGGKSLPSRILPGPMEGIMIANYCRVIMEFDLVSAWITPFIRISDNVPRAIRLADRLTPFRPLPMVAQLMGTRHELLAEAAAALSQMEILGVELNCACPSPTVLRSGSGSALLAKPEWIRDTILAIREAVSGRCGVGVKIRSGLSSPSELPGICGFVCQAKPDWVVHHYRTAEESYKPVSNRVDRFHQSRQALCDSVLFGSGDLFDAVESVQLAEQTGLDGLTPARGMVHNPWLIRQMEAVCRGEAIKQPRVSTFLTRLITQTATTQQQKWRPGLILEIACNIWGRRSERFKALAACSGPDEMLRILQSK